ncbi:TPA: phage shock protein A [Candidatus Poribacteria bacterium]|nr:phage shock protein A [Candidatus Poribacteria bacterium]
MIMEVNLMPIFEKIRRIIKSNLNDILDRAEDPEKMLEQIIQDMQQELKEAKIQVASAIRDQHKLEGQYAENLEIANKWEERAVAFVRNGDDLRAKESLKRKRSFSELADNFKEQLDVQKESVNALKQGLTNLESKIEEARRQKALLIARKRRAEAQRKISETMAGLSSANASGVFDKIQSKIEDAEARAQAGEEIQSLNLESQFAALESEDDIDTELAELKAKLKES